MSDENPVFPEDLRDDDEETFPPTEAFHSEDVVSHNARVLARISSVIAFILTPFLCLLVGAIAFLIGIVGAALGALLSPCAGLLTGFINLFTKFNEKSGFKNHLFNFFLGIVIGFFAPISYFVSYGKFLAPSIVAAFTLPPLAANRAYTKTFQTGKLSYLFHVFIDFYKTIKYSLELKNAAKNSDHDALNQLIPAKYQNNSHWFQRGVIWLASLPWMIQATSTYGLVGTINGGLLGAGFGAAGGSAVGGPAGTAAGASTGAMIGALAGSVIVTPVAAVATTCIVARTAQFVPDALEMAQTECRYNNLTTWSQGVENGRHGIKQDLLLHRTNLVQRQTQKHDIHPEMYKLLIKLVDRVGLDLTAKTSASSERKLAATIHYINEFVREGDAYWGTADEIANREIIKVRRKGYEFFSAFEEEGTPHIIAQLEKFKAGTYTPPAEPTGNPSSYYERGHTHNIIVETAIRHI